MGGKDFQDEAMLAAVKPLKPRIQQCPRGQGRCPCANFPWKIQTVWKVFPAPSRSRLSHGVPGYGQCRGRRRCPADSFSASRRGRNRPRRLRTSRHILRARLLTLRWICCVAGAARKPSVSKRLRIAPACRRSCQSTIRQSIKEDRELRELLIEALSRLGPTAAQMFALRYFEGFGNGEIATVMKTSPLVVGVTLHRARARLRKEIGRYLRYRE